MSHHIHPLIDPEDDPETGERRSLQSCRPKTKKGKRDDNVQACKSGFPLLNEMTDRPLVVCECIAHHRNLPTRGPRSMLGDILPARNDAWLNAGPRALIAFAADNADIKFPWRLPIQTETHEVLLYDVQRQPSCGLRSTQDQALDMQAVMAAVAGYFGGYTSKMQPTGERETRQLREAAERKMQGEKRENAARDFQRYVRRLVKDLEMKGTIRTAVESINLSLCASHNDVLMSECIRTFPTVTFPAALLLKREEIETLKVSGASIIAALHHGHGQKARMYADAPLDLMYGFRGRDEEVDLLTPYEMLLLYRAERILPPTCKDAVDFATWTAERTRYRKQCLEQHVKPEYEAGVHYVAIPAKHRILLPELPALRGLRHRWCWEARARPHLPTWSFAKVPRPDFSPDENARLLSVYLRPWTLNPAESTALNPLLSILGKCQTIGDRLVPVWAQLQDEVEAGTDQPCSSGAAQDGAGAGPQRSKRRRLTCKASASGGTTQDRYSYAASWEAYIDGHIVSDSSRRFITNLMAATAAIKSEDSVDSSEDSDAEAWLNMNVRAGNMDLVHRTLQGMAAKSSDEGMKAIGRHARTIRLGRALWQSPPLDANATASVEERFFDDGSVPPQAEIRKAVAKAKKLDEQRPSPFAGKTQPFTHLSVVNYGQRLQNWLDAVKLEDEAPTTQQLGVLQRVSDRVLLEFELEKEGLLLPKGHPERCAAEQPLLGFCHGCPGTGKSRLIKWIRRLFIEALGWQHEDEFLCVAFQNRVAHAMEGTTIHSGGDIGIGGQRALRLEHTDIDVLLTRGQYLRWVIIDELPMVPDEPLGAFEHHLANAAVDSRFKRTADKSVCVFGGYNVLGFGDFYQIPPIPPSTSLNIPPADKKTELATMALNLMWGVVVTTPSTILSS